MNQTVRHGPFEYVVDASPVTSPQALARLRHNYVGRVVRLVRLPEDDGLLPIFFDLGRFAEHPADSEDEAVRKVMAEVALWIQREEFRMRHVKKDVIRKWRRPPFRRRAPE